MPFDIIQIIVCPVCREALGSTTMCVACGTAFIQSMGYPVLIDFDDSIFTPLDYQSPSDVLVPRLKHGSWIKRAVRRLTFGTNKAARPNIQIFIDRLLQANRPRVLIIGGGSIGSGIDCLYKHENVLIVGVDVYASPHIALICDGHKLPFADEAFDGVVIQAVLEHVLDPRRVVSEIYRVLKPDGIVYAETPFMQQVHEKAYDFSRFTLSGHRWLFREFAEVRAGSVLGPGTALLWSIKYFVRAISGSSGIAAVTAALFFWLRLFDTIVKRGPALDAASGLYFIGTKSTSPMKANELPGYYMQYR